jgi:hypothetical protein
VLLAVQTTAGNAAAQRVARACRDLPPVVEPGPGRTPTTIKTKVCDDGSTESWLEKVDTMGRKTTAHRRIKRSSKPDGVERITLVEDSEITDDQGLVTTKSEATTIDQEGNVSTATLWTDPSGTTVFIVQTVDPDGSEYQERTTIDAAGNVVGPNP